MVDVVTSGRLAYSAIVFKRLCQNKKSEEGARLFLLNDCVVMLSVSISSLALSIKDPLRDTGLSKFSQDYSTEY